MRTQVQSRYSIPAVLAHKYNQVQENVTFKLHSRHTKCKQKSVTNLVQSASQRLHFAPFNKYFKTHQASKCSLFLNTQLLFSNYFAFSQDTMSKNRISFQTECTSEIISNCNKTSFSGFPRETGCLQ